MRIQSASRRAFAPFLALVGAAAVVLGASLLWAERHAVRAPFTDYDFPPFVQTFRERSYGWTIDEDAETGERVVERFPWERVMHLVYRNRGDWELTTILDSTGSMQPGDRQWVRDGRFFARWGLEGSPVEAGVTPVAHTWYIPIASPSGLVARGGWVPVDGSPFVTRRRMYEIDCEDEAGYIACGGQTTGSQKEIVEEVREAHGIPVSSVTLRDGERVESIETLSLTFDDVPPR